MLRRHLSSRALVTTPDSPPAFTALTARCSSREMLASRLFCKSGASIENGHVDAHHGQLQVGGNDDVLQIYAYHAWVHIVRPRVLLLQPAFGVIVSVRI